MFKPLKKWILGTVVALVATTAAHAQAFPSKPIKILVPFAPGGGTDMLARILASKMSQGLGQQVIVENRAGGNTLIATEATVHSPADGYTLLMQTNNFTVNPTLYRGKLNYQTRKDLVPVALVAGNPHVLVVNPKLPVHNIKEFIAYAKANPGKLTFGTAGSGTVNHLTAELLKMRAGIDLTHVPYKGSGALMPDLLAGQVDCLFAAMPTVTQFIKDGKLRALAVTTPQRFSSLPDVPPLAESGFPDYDLSSWFGLLAPAGTPELAIERLNGEVRKVLKDPAVRALLKDYVIYGSTAQEFGTFLDADIDKNAKIITASGAKVD